MAAPQPPPGPGTAGPFGSSAPGIASHPQQQHAHPSAAAVEHYRVALGMGLEAYAPTLEDAYRPPGGAAVAATHGLAGQQQQQQVAFERMHAQAAAVAAATAAAAPQGGQFGLLAPAAVPALGPHGGAEAVFGTVAPETTPQQQTAQDLDKTHGPLCSRLVLDPPDLDAWREKLFNVDETIVLTHEQFETYFPHVDNVYSHRSTQRYKRKPFVSHYWDCRMKGRPPGTPKSDDPNKKKRKRSARERDLCDVKIKITEYLPGAQLQLDDFPGGGAAAIPPEAAVHQGVFVPGPLSVGEQRIWTIQRVNGNGGNGKRDGVAGPHKHTLAKSDEIKKNSVQRLVAKQEKEAKKAHKPVMRKPTGAALATVKRHTREHDLKLYAACFCPFSQRVWIALEAKGLTYQYAETDPFRRPAPAPLLEASPQGRIPAIQQGNWACAESGVILEYLQDLDQSVQLYPSNPQLKANCRLWIDHINTRIIPPFFALLKAEDPTSQAEPFSMLQNTIKPLVQAADEEGPFFLGSQLSLVDVHFAPFALRFSRILAPLRGWSMPAKGSRLARWIEALEDDTHVRATMSNDDLYLETAGLWAEYDA
ncbi:hypothetical protein B0T10DRAFT_477324 [Thelonectria olida]|uniref:GST N-terminal domain-containing protein n=1 Tax=Thelonectria olida TaxID=1576542 RepID=A0A9P8WDQ5_9HYPO|nr:hypothetical protein B0T10DRAFT_477324 [Thelonectria olida]